MGKKASGQEEEKKREEMLKRMADMPDWSEEEFEEMGSGLRGYIAKGLRLRAEARRYLGRKVRETGKCARCGTEFRVEGSGQIYCSDECGYAYRQREYRKRKKGKKRA